MKYTAKVISIGTSKYVLIPANIINIVNLEPKDLVEIDISKIDQEEPKTYRCSVCEYVFSTYDEIPGCPSCGTEESIKEVENGDSTE